MTSFSKQLILWYSERKRDLPWRASKNPYPVWLSEIILQQTRVEQGLPYWYRFMETYPTIHDLARAEEGSILRLWQGLGYYSRARNLHATAKYISLKLGGKFPDTYEEILKLKGIGPYTAAAISSICYGLPKPVVDGNVFRFAARYFGIEEDIALPMSRKVFEKILEKQIDKKNPGTFNQAMMEHGATVCSPSPKCRLCFFQEGCFAFKNDRQTDLPLKTKKPQIKIRHLNYVVFKVESKYLLNQRKSKDIWQGLYDFYLVEGDLTDVELVDLLNEKLRLKGRLHLKEYPMIFTHILSHRKLLAKFYEVTLDGENRKLVLQNTLLASYSVKELLDLPKPKLILNYLKKLNIN